MPPGALAEVARACSPRVKVHAEHLVTLDISGLGQLLGDARAIGEELRRAAADRGLAAHVAVAVTGSAAWLLASGRPGLTVALPGDERRLLADLPLSVLGVAKHLIRGQRPGTRGQHARHWPLETDEHELPLGAFRRWGLRTLGDLAALPPAALSERLGQDGVWWQRLARGEDPGPLVPDRPEKPYETSLNLEWPIEGIEPLSFVLGRLFEPLCAELERDDHAAAVVHVALTLVTRETEVRTLHLPAPMRDPRVLRTLVLLNLEGHPITAGIDRITVTADPAPGRIVQCSLLGRALPLPEQIAPLVARLGALMGEERVGAAALVDSHRPEAFRMTAFNSQGLEARGRGLAGGVDSRQSTVNRRSTIGSRQATGSSQVPVASQPPTPDTQVLITKYQVPSNLPRAPSLAPGPRPLVPVLRRFRFPVPARVVVQEDVPLRVTTDRRGLEGGRVERCAGPWITSGEWWHLSDARLQTRADGTSIQVGWNRDEWDVALGDGGIYRVYRDRDSRRWFIDGIMD